MNCAIFKVSAFCRFLSVWYTFRRVRSRGWFSKARSIACGLSIFGVLAACTNQSASRPGDLAGLPHREDGIKNIEIHRDRAFLVGYTTLMYVTVNGEDIGTVGAGASVKFGLAEGRYNIGVRCSKSDGIFVGWQHNEIPAEIGTEAVDIYVSYIGCNLRI